MTQKILSLDLGTHSLKALLLQRRFEDFEILDFTEIVLNHQLRLTHTEQLALALEQLLADEHWKNFDVMVSALPGQWLSSRVLEVPFLSHKKIQDVLNFELESYVPMPVEDLFSDFHVLNQRNESTQLLALYLTEDKVKSYMQVLSDKNLDAKYLGADLIELASIAHVAPLPKESFYLICDLGHTKTNLCIMEGNRLRYARTLGVGGFHFTRAIQRAYNLNYEKAEALKISRGRIYVREDESDQISRILVSVASELITLIKQTVMAFQAQAGQIPISAFYCTGGSSQIVGLLDYLSFHLKSNVMELDALSLVKHPWPENNDLQYKLAPVLSTALRPLYSARLPKVNFRKGRFAFKQDIQAVTTELKSSVFLLVLILMATAGYYFYADYHFSKRLKSIDGIVSQWIEDSDLDLDVATSSRRKESNQTQGVKRYLRAAEAKLAEVKKQLQDFSGGTEVTPLEAMQEISRLLPAKSVLNLQFSEFNFSDGFLKVTAETDDPLNVSKVVTALSQSLVLRNIEADDAKAKPNNVWDFSIKIQLAPLDNTLENEDTAQAAIE